MAVQAMVQDLCLWLQRGWFEVGSLLAVRLAKTKHEITRKQKQQLRFV